MDKRSRPLTAMNSNNNYSQGFNMKSVNTNVKSKNLFDNFINDCSNNTGNNFNPRPQSSVFFGDKTKTSEFFKTTRVDSCSHVVEHQGKTFAIPYKVVNHKGRPLSAFKYNNYKKEQYKSIYKTDYSIKPKMHVGMTKKPLVLYDPYSYRSRLPQADFFMAHKNQSNLDIGVKTDINRKQWISTTRDSYQWPRNVPISNSGIISDNFKNYHKKLVSHQ